MTDQADRGIADAHPDPPTAQTGSIGVVGVDGASNSLPAHCLRACLHGDPSLVSSHGCRWLTRATEGEIDTSELASGWCLKGYRVAAQPMQLADRTALILAVEDSPKPADSSLASDAALHEAHLAGQIVERIGLLVEENEGLAEEVLRSYEQLTLVFDVTQQISQISDVAELEQVLLCRLGTLLSLDVVYVLGADESRRHYALPSGPATEAGPGEEIEAALADEIARVRETGKVRVAPAGPRSFILGPLRRLDEKVDVVLGSRPQDGEPFASGDMLLLESMLSYGAELIGNNELHDRLKQTAIESIRALINAIDKKDHYTCGHSERVAFWARMTGREMGLPAIEQELLEWAGHLHDVGKIGIPEAIVNKPGKLTAEEFDAIKQHPVMGYEILKPVASFQPILEATLYHHENPDGTGYPEGLEGDAIPLAARIMRAADVFDALYSERSYRRAFSLEKVLEIIRNDAGTKIDAESAAALITVVESFRQRRPDDFVAMYKPVRRPDDDDT